MSIPARLASDPDRWYAIWDILFPGVAHPPSPFLDVSHEQRSIEIGAAIENFRQSGGTQRFLGQLGVKEDVGVLDHFLNYFYNECSTATNEQQITTSNQPLPSRSQSPSTSVSQPTTQPKPERPTESQSQQGPSGTSHILQHLAKPPAGEPPRTVTNIESDIESVVSAVFSEASLDSSRSSTYTNVHVLAILDLANLLLHDDTMVTLYPQAMARLGSSRFQRNFTRLLKQYSKNLKQEATDELHFEAARFIRQYARRVANELTNMIQPRGYDDDRLQGGIDAISKEKELDRWIESRNWLQSASENFENDDEEDNLSDSSDSTAASDSGNSPIGSLQGIRIFLVSSEAHSILRRDFGKWLNIEVEKKNGDDESSVADIPDTDYDVFVSLQIAARITNKIKRTIEKLAGCKLSWWPLSQPGSDPNTGYTRVYSKSSFDSFLFKNSLNLYYISVHRDQERYPQAADPEYIEYRFQPRPWPTGALYPSNEVWYYFRNPDDCGTSTDLNQILSVRIQGRLGSRARAFGIHIEEAYSVWAILVPSFVVVSVTLAATAWFIPLWLSTHPGDLQNATVPITVVFTVVGSLLQVVISLVIFRWTPK
ncbi:hypothetical protein NUW58_g123 [Xylaria curta]|uniref:Uncharacterized protein n=1 Tax=Xylaria curta TaxID=42375 RepID=A0ACC1PRU9_9PEZI|nr:hypothetical protein NUW58_g123 [Xylaria curta]